MSILMRHMMNKGGAQQVLPPLTGVIEGLPGLLEFLTITNYPDGSVRQRSTIGVFVEDGLVKVCLNDRDTSRTLWRSGQSLEDCLLSLEVALQEPGTDWRQSSTGKAPARGRK